MNYITKNFTYEELTHSNIAARLGIDNTPNEVQKRELSLLAELVLQPIRNEVGPLHVSSGFRCEKLNKSTPGSSKKSQHMLGQAADIWSSAFNPSVLFFMIPDILENEYNQLILEYGQWVHVSRSNKPRRQKLICTLKNGKPHYEPV